MLSLPIWIVKTFQFALHSGFTLGQPLRWSWLDLDSRTLFKHLKFDPWLTPLEFWAFWSIFEIGQNGILGIFGQYVRSMSQNFVCHCLLHLETSVKLFPTDTEGQTLLPNYDNDKNGLFLRVVHLVVNAETCCPISVDGNRNQSVDACESHAPIHEYPKCADDLQKIFGGF